MAAILKYHERVNLVKTLFLQLTHQYIYIDCFTFFIMIEDTIK